MFVNNFVSQLWPVLNAWIAHLWLWITYVGYGLAVFFMFVIVYATVRLFELRRREHEFYSTLIVPPKSSAAPHPRWQHIESLATGKTPSEWKEAIIEADVLLDEILTERGFEGDTLGDKLKSADANTFKTLHDAWEAHKVRNQIAHQGSAFKLSEIITNRTLAHYRNVFEEFQAL